MKEANAKAAVPPCLMHTQLFDDRTRFSVE